MEKIGSGNGILGKRIETKTLIGLLVNVVSNLVFVDQKCDYDFSASRPQEKVKIIKNVSGLLKTYFPNTFPLNKILNICSRDIVAVVDPPRAGLHAKALSAIRNTLSIRQVLVP